jgi:membrane dipeptidase
MHRTGFIGLAAAVLLAGCVGAAKEEAEVARAREIHDRVLTLDTHVDIPFNYATDEVDPGVRGRHQVDLPKMREGGLDAAFFIVYVGQGPRTVEGNANAKASAMTKFDAIRRMTYELYPDQIELAYTAADVERIHESGKLVAAIGIENGYVIGRDLSLIETYHDLGARYMTLAHGGHNDISDSATPRAGEPAAEYNGLSEFGEEVVAELNRVGIMVDVSHISKDAMLHAIRVSKAPVIGSHSSTRALADVARNMDDEQLLALKANGGVVQMCALDGFVKVPAPERGEAIRALREELGIVGRDGLRNLTPEQRTTYDERMAAIETKWPRANISDFADHIDYAVNLIGIDHVGIASDFDGGGGITGWNDASETFNLTLELVRRGYSEEEIAKLWGGNLLRVWGEVERVAAESRVADE